MASKDFAILFFIDCFILRCFIQSWVPSYVLQYSWVLEQIRTCTLQKLCFYSLNKLNDVEYNLYME